MTAAGEGGRATTPKAADKAKKAEACKKLAPAAKKKDVAKSRRIKKAHKVELECADAVEGSNLPDSEPADVVRLQNMNGTLVRDPQDVRAAMARRAKAIRAIKGDWSGEGVMGVREDATDERKAQIVDWARRVLGGDGKPESRVVFFEVKTLQKAGQNRVRNTAKALARKQDWEERYGVEFVTVLVDERKGKKYSGHRVYVAPGVAKTTRIDQCEKADSMAAILKLMGAKGELPLQLRVR